MTTIAYDGKTLCTDSKVTSGEIWFGSATKLYRLGSGALLAIGGDLALAYEVMLWLDDKADKPAVAGNERVTALLIEPSGAAWEYNERLRRFPACVPWAGGSGEVVAMTAMRCGKTAREAVEMACEMDSCSAGPVQEMAI